MNQLNDLPQAKWVQYHKDGKNGIHSEQNGKVESNVPLKHFLEFIIFHSSHSNPHYIKLKVSLPTYSEFIFL